MTKPTTGPVEAATAAALASTATASTPMREALAELALSLARFLDEGAGNSTPATAAQLRICLEDLTPPDTSADDRFHAFVADVTT